MASCGVLVAPLLVALLYAGPQPLLLLGPDLNDREGRGSLQLQFAAALGVGVDPGFVSLPLAASFPLAADMMVMIGVLSLSWCCPSCGRCHWGCLKGCGARAAH